MIKTPQKKEGFVIIIALIVSVIVLTVGIGIISITLKDYLFSGVVTESHKAFYAADTGLDCAFYYDIQNDGFATPAPIPSGPTEDPTDDPFFSTTYAANSITCGSQTLTPTISCGESGTIRSCTISFDTLGSATSPSCFETSVIYKLNHRGTVAVSDDGESVTVISRGWNTCDSNNLRRLERALELTYGDSS